jgi:transcriptional regulator with XRE-family HTH domain
MNIGNKIKELRNNANLTQEQLADKCGFSKNAIWNYENDKRSPDIKVLIKIAEALGVTINDLFPSKKIPLQSLIDTTDAIREEIIDINGKKRMVISIPSGKERINELQNSFKILLDNIPQDQDCKKKNTDILNNAKNIAKTAKNTKFEDVICNDREHLLFGFKCLLTNYALDWSKFTEDELMEIINSRSLFDFFSKFINTYYNFFISKNEILNQEININNTDTKKE